MSDDRKVFKFDGEKVDVSWDGRLCIHVGECTRATGALFESGRKPWCRPDLGEPDYVTEVVRRCPTGALVYRRKDGGAEETAATTNTVSVINNGPLYLQGSLEIDGAADNMPGVRFRAALCRCGASRNKPFCDNTHEDSGFRDSGAVGETGPGLESSGGPLSVQRAKNGPLLLNGPLTIRSAGGRVAWQGNKTALCRCGESKNKPFCDGSHKQKGFEAE